MHTLVENIFSRVRLHVLPGTGMTLKRPENLAKQCQTALVTLNMS
jgi:hypothetical protein